MGAPKNRWPTDSKRIGISVTKQVSVPFSSLSFSSLESTRLFLTALATAAAESINTVPLFIWLAITSFKRG